MTIRLYYTDATLREFDARVERLETVDGQTEVVLDQTAFYPTSGGQPFDTGRLGDALVTDVFEHDDGTIRHRVAGAVLPGSVVRGSIDWPRRLDHMQQHTGQHILSAAFDRLLGVRTESFHMGADVSTIDLAREVSAEEIARVEADANTAVWDDRAVRVRFVSEAEAATLPLRKPPARTGPLRLVDVDAFDLSACGGTHVARTGVIGLIAVTHWERTKGASRVTFVCGGRALRSHATLRDVVLAASRALSTPPADLPAHIARLQQEARDADRARRRLEEELAVARGVALRSQATAIGTLAVVVAEETSADAAVLKRLAQSIVSEGGLVALVVGDGGTPVPVVLARSGDITLDMGALIRELTAALGGRGGGRPELAQGGVPASASEIVTFLRKRIADRGASAPERTKEP